MMIRASIWISAIGMFGLASAIPGAAQGMMQHVDLTSPEMTSAEMTRADVESLIAFMLQWRDQWGELIPLSPSELTDSYLDQAVLPN